jgi:hypothetical protein
MKSKNSWLAQQFIRWAGAEQILGEGLHAEHGLPRHLSAPPERSGNPSEGLKVELGRSLHSRESRGPVYAEAETSSQVPL